MKIFYAAVLLAITYSSLAEASETDYFTIMDSMVEVAPERVGYGRIQEIDLDYRTIIVSGFMYFFGPESIDKPLVVRMMGANYGALGMLETGMFVEVHYLPSPTYRVARKLIQIEPQEEF